MRNYYLTEKDANYIHIIIQENTHHHVDFFRCDNRCLVIFRNVVFKSSQDANNMMTSMKRVLMDNGVEIREELTFSLQYTEQLEDIVCGFEMETYETTT
jgi:hypothetical protein